MKIINTILNKEKNSPIWIMRQAGRYLPEYMQIRSKVNNFLDLCYNPNLASEVTLQPIKRFDFDAAIIFSDILVIPDAIGIKVEFLKNHGPKLSPINNLKDLNNLKLDNNKFLEHLKPVFEALNITRQNLDNDKALIGFAGSPWTIATYIIEGGGSKHFDLVKKTAIKDEIFFGKLIDILVEKISLFLIKQIENGANIVKLFDSWAGILSDDLYKNYVIEPNKKIVENVRKTYPNIPIITFPRGSAFLYKDFFEQVKPDVLAFDQNCPKKWISDNFSTCIQGNFDNFLLAFGSKDKIKIELEKTLEIFKDKSHIFNLGHGILPETPIENVEYLIKLIRSYK